jgi:hypothetical protein
MFLRDLHRVRLTYSRTASEAFKDLHYSAAVEKPAPRSGYGWLWWTLICASALAGAVAIALGERV